MGVAKFSGIQLESDWSSFPDFVLAQPQLLPLLLGQPLVAVHREVVALVVDHLMSLFICIDFRDYD